MGAGLAGSSNELLFGCLDDEVEAGWNDSFLLQLMPSGALHQRKVHYDEVRRLSDGSDSYWSYSGSD